MRSIYISVCFYYQCSCSCFFLLYFFYFLFYASTITNEKTNEHCFLWKRKINNDVYCIDQSLFYGYYCNNDSAVCEDSLNLRRTCMISTVGMIKARDWERHAFCRVEVEASHNMWTASDHLIISGFGTHKSLAWLGSAWLMRMRFQRVRGPEREEWMNCFDFRWRNIAEELLLCLLFVWELFLFCLRIINFLESKFSSSMVDWCGASTSNCKFGILSYVCFCMLQLFSFCLDVRHVS
jgi:hypothetical protein